MYIRLFVLSDIWLTHYISPRYMNGTPKELTRLATQLTGRLSIHKANSVLLPILVRWTMARPINAFEVWLLRWSWLFYQIITPVQFQRKTHSIPSPLVKSSYVIFWGICRLLLNYGLRVSELLLLECHSIKPNLGDQFGWLWGHSRWRRFGSTKRLPSLKCLKPGAGIR